MILSRQTTVSVYRAIRHTHYLYIVATNITVNNAGGAETVVGLTQYCDARKTKNAAW